MVTKRNLDTASPQVAFSREDTGDHENWCGIDLVESTGTNVSLCETTINSGKTEETQTGYPVGKKKDAGEIGKQNGTDEASSSLRKSEARIMRQQDIRQSTEYGVIRRGGIEERLKHNRKLLDTAVDNCETYHRILESLSDEDRTAYGDYILDKQYQQKGVI